MNDIVSNSPEETASAAAAFIDALHNLPGKRGTATIVALQGELGAGKTVFVKGAAKHLGVETQVTSPTFVIEKTYKLAAGQPWERLVHIDAYRLEGEEELRGIDWSTVATDPKNLILIEWPEQVGLGIPERAHWIEFEVQDENSRVLHLPEGFSVEMR